MSTMFEHHQSHSTLPRSWIGGVCAALAGIAGVEPWIIRLAASGLLLWHPLWLVVLYLAATAFIRNGNAPIMRRLHAFIRRSPTAPRGGDTGLSALARQLAALDRRLANLEAMISAPNDTLSQKFRNL
jgi:phage shock protein PspC (stress-responsive transcriptional regulator)